jgi:flotillin
MGLELTLVIGGISIVALTAIFFTVKNLIVICHPSEVVIFSGPKAQGSQRSGYIHIRGGRRLRIPLLERVEHMNLSTMSVDVAVRGAYTRDGVPINVQGVANIKIDGDMPGLDNAVERLMGKSNQEIMRIARQTLEGNLRGVLAKLTPEQVNEDKRSAKQNLLCKQPATSPKHVLAKSMPASPSFALKPISGLFPHKLSVRQILHANAV